MPAVKSDKRNDVIIFLTFYVTDIGLMRIAHAIFLSQKGWEWRMS